MVKEYSVEHKNPESGETKRQKLGPAYFEDSPEFEKEMTFTISVLRQAAYEVFAGAYVWPGQSGVVRQHARIDAELFAKEAESRLKGKKHDATPALAMVEGSIELLDSIEDKLQEQVEDSEDEVRKRTVDIQDVREKRRDFIRASEFLYSLHPELTRLYTREDMLDWMRQLVDNIAHSIKKLKLKDSDVSTVLLGRMTNEEESMRRYLAGSQVPADSDVILSHIEDDKDGIRKALAERVIILTGVIKENYEQRFYDAEEKRMVKFEETLSQYYQMQRILEEERRKSRIPKIKQ